MQSSVWAYDIASDHKPLTTTGGHVWPAAQRLAEFLESESPMLGLDRMGVTVLELGAGVGWLGITMARNLPGLACMLLTEQEQGGGVTWLRHNVEINHDTPNVARSVFVAPCDWGVFLSGRGPDGERKPEEASGGGTPEESSSGHVLSQRTALESFGPAPQIQESSSHCLLPASSVGRLDPVMGRPWDFIIGSDLIYTEEGCRTLPRVMQALATRGHTQIFYCHTKHRLVCCHPFLSSHHMYMLSSF